jgi:predicted HicB family RNase H-like nuclease
MTNQIEYKGYLVDLVVDAEDDCIYGSVVNAEKLHLTIEGATVSEAKQAFVSAIDDYLVECQVSGWEVIEPKMMAINK